MPKWTNKGAEFDRLGAVFLENSSIAIVGSEYAFTHLKRKLEFLEVPILNNPQDFNGKTIILTGYEAYNIDEFAKQHGLEKNVRVFSEDNFFIWYLSIFAVYVANKIYIDSISFICTTLCNLNCKYCLSFQPYIKRKAHIPLDMLKKDVDIFFTCTDRLGLFHISGGEPLLFPYLTELITYVAENYADKIECISSSTNASVVPSDTVCEVMQKYGVRMYMDDYRSCVPRLETTFTAVQDKLNAFMIETIAVKDDSTGFFKLFPPHRDDSNLSEAQLCDKFNSCKIPFTELKNGKLYHCNWSEFAATAGILPGNDAEAYDLTTHNASRNKELIEYRLGYSDKGYVELCKYCNGNLPINKTKTPPGLQVQGNLNWDRARPTEITSQSGKSFQELCAEEDKVCSAYYQKMFLKTKSELAQTKSELAQTKSELAQTMRITAHPVIRALRKANALLKGNTQK